MINTTGGESFCHVWMTKTTSFDIRENFFFISSSENDKAKSTVMSLPSFKDSKFPQSNGLFSHIKVSPYKLN